MHEVGVVQQAGGLHDLLAFDLGLEQQLYGHRPSNSARSASHGTASTRPRSIRRRYAEGEVSLADLATEYSVGRSTIHRIIHNPET